MIKVNSFPYNDFQINTFIISAENNDCIIIDPGCYYTEEKEHLKKFIEDNNLNPILLLNTHGHIDHVAGNSFVKDTFNIKSVAHIEDEPIMRDAESHGLVFGFNVVAPPPLDEYLEDGDVIEFGNDQLQIYHVPGHSPGSIAIHSKKNNFIISGDVLFKGSIGRTDLPGGDYETLIDSIKEKLLVLDDNLTVYSGHGPSTTIGEEKNTNPYLK